MALPKKSTGNEIPEEDKIIFKSTGLNTVLQPKFGLKTAKHDSCNIEGFLTAVERNFLK